ncbi:MAG: DUF58 domain-containing protein [Lachnospiraceae bacterium]|nr:DUF58 domain-containing protein [Lachnospiraceae bacterium]
MIKSYVGKIRSLVSIYSAKKSSSLFDGSYKSIFKGNGFDFENLREYIPGDNIRDIDWKASSRGGKLLVKRYIAEKQHNIMLVFDTGKKMSANAKGQQPKKQVALNAGGAIGYLAAKNGDNVGAMYNRDGMFQYFQLKPGMENIERILAAYDKEQFADYYGDITKTLDYIVKNIRRRMVIFVISDASGIKSISEDTLKKLTYQHDVLVMDISDADLTDGNSYNIDRDRYIPDYISENKKLREIEQNTKKQIYEENEKKLIKYRIVSTKIDSEEQIVERIIELLGGHKYANCR